MQLKAKIIQITIHNKFMAIVIEPEKQPTVAASAFRIVITDLSLRNYTLGEEVTITIE